MQKFLNIKIYTNMTNFLLKVSRKSTLEFPKKKRVKHGKGKTIPTNALLLAHYSLATIERYVDKDINEQFETYLNRQQYKDKFNIGLTFIEGTLQKSVPKRQLSPFELLYATSKISCNDINEAIQKIVKQWLIMHGAKIPTNKDHFKELVKERNSRLKSDTWQNYLTFEGEFWAEIEMPNIWERGKSTFFTQKLQINGLDTKGNFVVDKKLFERMKHILNNNIVSSL